MKVTIIPIVIGAFGTVTKGLLDHPNYNIIENGQNTEKSPGDLRWQVITQSPVKDHQRKLMVFTLMSK